MVKIAVKIQANATVKGDRLARKLGNSRLKQIRLHPFRHFYATMLFAKTLNILKVQQAVDHMNLTNTQLYTHLINFDCDEYNVQVAENLEEQRNCLKLGSITSLAWTVGSCSGRESNNLW